MKTIKILLSLLITLCIISGCASSQRSEDTLLVSATLDPHSRILEEAKPILLDEYGITLEIEVLDDYYIFNKALDGGDVDANYFQHLPFFENEVNEYGYDIVNAGGIHIEPFGIYSTTLNSIDELQDGATIIVSNSVADNGRILNILADAGLIKLPESTNVFEVTIADIDNAENNPRGFKFVEIKPELLVQTYNNNEGDLVAINGNYAIQGGLNPASDALIIEEASLDNPYVNIVATSSKLKDDKRIKALIDVLQSDKIQNFINETYAGSVIPTVK